MGIDLTFTSKLPRKGLAAVKPEKFLDAALDALADAAGDRMWNADTQDLGPHGLEAYVRLHPSAEPIRLNVADGQVTLDARTSGTGPGYHQFVCDVAGSLAERLKLQWTAEDETGYFAHRDRARLESAMLEWIQTLCEAMLQEPPDDLDSPFAITMPVGFEAPSDGSFAVTPAGPRTRAWMESIARDAALGRSFFTWWDNPPSARDMLDEALVWMWMESHWNAPRTEAEAAGFSRTLNLLSAAHEADPALEMPWREWAELLALVAPEDAGLVRIRDRANSVPSTTRLIGYRRAESITAAAPGGWTIRIPGSFSEMVEDTCWTAFDESRTIRVSSMSGQRDGQPVELPPPHADRPQGTPLLTRPMPGGRATAYIATETEDGDTYQQLTGEIVVMDDTSLDVGFLTVAFDDPRHRDWAERVWESFTPPRRHSVDS